jgi:hypothetical protein
MGLHAGAAASASDASRRLTFPSPVPDERSTDPLFVRADGQPRLVRCAVLFLDILGMREITRAPAEEVERRLRDLDRAVTDMSRDYLEPTSPFPAAFFSDAFVVAAPIEDEAEEQETVQELLFQTALLQLNFLAAGFYVRGGVSIAPFHIRNRLIFGPALVEAYELESAVAIYPRVVLSDEVAALAERPNSLLVSDREGRTFVNYLDLVFDDPDGGSRVVEAHRDMVVARLRRHDDRKGVWEKYRWVAEYHNDFVARELEGAEDALVPAESMAWRFAPFA